MQRLVKFMFCKDCICVWGARKKSPRKGILILFPVCLVHPGNKPFHRDGRHHSLALKSVFMAHLTILLTTPLSLQ